MTPREARARLGLVLDAVYGLEPRSLGSHWPPRQIGLLERLGQLGRAPLPPAEAWETLATRELIPAAWVDDPRRRFTRPPVWEAAGRVESAGHAAPAAPDGPAVEALRSGPGMLNVAAAAERQLPRVPGAQFVVGTRAGRPEPGRPVPVGTLYYATDEGVVYALTVPPFEPYPHSAWDAAAYALYAAQVASAEHIARAAHRERYGEEAPRILWEPCRPWVPTGGVVATTGLDAHGERLRELAVERLGITLDAGCVRLVLTGLAA